MSTIHGFSPKSFNDMKNAEMKREAVEDKKLQSQNLYLRVFTFILAATIGAVVAVMTSQPWEVIIPFAILCGLAPLFTAIFISAINRQVTIAKMRDGSVMKDTND